jgi:DNA-binding transcriptional MerR regulator
MKTFATKRFGPKEICQLLNLSHRQLDYWVLIGVVKPILEPHGRKIFKKFTDDDLNFLREVKSLTDEGFLVSKAAQKVRDHLPKPETEGRENEIEPGR